MPKEGEGCHHDSGEARLEDRLVLIPRIMPHAARVARNPRTEVGCGDPPKFRMTRADLSELGNRPSLAFEHASRLMENETEGELYFLERIPGSLFW